MNNLYIKINNILKISQKMKKIKKKKNNNNKTYKIYMNNNYICIKMI